MSRSAETFLPVGESCFGAKQWRLAAGSPRFPAEFPNNGPVFAAQPPGQARAKSTRHLRFLRSQTALSAKCSRPAPVCLSTGRTVWPFAVPPLRHGRKERVRDWPWQLFLRQDPAAHSIPGARSLTSSRCGPRVRGVRRHTGAGYPAWPDRRRPVFADSPCRRSRKRQRARHPGSAQKNCPTSRKREAPWFQSAPRRLWQSVARQSSSLRRQRPEAPGRAPRLRPTTSTPEQKRIFAPMSVRT